MKSIFPLKVPQLPIPVQLALGVLGGIGNFLFSFIFVKVFSLPLFMDCVFTIASSFFGIVAGLVSAVGFHFFAYLSYPDESPAFFFCICSVTLVLIVRAFVVRDKRSGTVEAAIFRIFLMNFVCILAISVEGDIIFSFVTQLFNYQEVSAITSFFSALLQSGVPFFLSSILGRIGVNFVDKTISFALAVLLVKRLCGAIQKRRRA